MKIKILVLLWFFLVLATSVTTVVARGLGPACVEGTQAGMTVFVFGDARQIVPVTFEEVCGQAVPVATGNEAVALVQVGVVRPMRVDFVLEGVPGTEGVLYWQVTSASVVLSQDQK